MNMDKPTAGSIDQEGLKAELDTLLTFLHDLKETFERCNRDADVEWRQISTTLDSVMEENLEPTLEKKKVGEPLFHSRPAGLHKGFSLGRGRPLKSMLDQRERIHERGRVSNREVISNLIKGNIALAENFKSVISAVCVERDHKVAELEAKYQKLWEEYEELACDPSRRPTRMQVMMAGFEGKRWSGTFEGMSFWEAWDMAKAKGEAMCQNEQPDVVSDDNYVTKDEEEKQATPDPPKVQQKEERWGDGLDEQFKGLWAWKPRPQTSEPVISTAQVSTAPQEEERRPRPRRFIRKDNSDEAIYLSCMVMNCTEENLIRPLHCLIDTGASVNTTSMREINRLGLKYERMETGDVTLATGTTVRIKAVARNVELWIGGVIVQVDLHILPIHEQRLGETILGTGFLRSTGAVIDFTKGRLSFNEIDPDQYYPWCYAPGGARRH